MNINFEMLCVQNMVFWGRLDHPYDFYFFGLDLIVIP